MEWLTWALIAVFVGWVFFQTVRVVPQREVFVVERLGRFYKSLEAGFHILIPFIDKVSYKHTLKEQTIDVPSQRLYYQRQYRSRNRWHFVPPGSGCTGCELWYSGLSLRFLTVGSNDASFRNRTN